MALRAAAQRVLRGSSNGMGGIAATGVFRSSPAVLSTSKGCPFGSHHGFASSADTQPLVGMPTLDDEKQTSALRHLLATSWTHIDSHVASEVKKVLTASSSTSGGKAQLERAWDAAQAVELFAGKLDALRSDLDDLSGGKFGGHVVSNLPQGPLNALETAFAKYLQYVSSFPSEEVWLRKKVEVDLGGVMLQLKQRCAGLDADWSVVSLLGTKGLSGSYVELRSKV